MNPELYLLYGPYSILTFNLKVFVIIIICNIMIMLRLSGTRRGTIEPIK